MEFQKINPVGKRVVVEVYESAGQSNSGILLAHNSNTAAGKVLGTIVEAGDESRFRDKVGSLVFFRRYSIDELKYIDKNGEKTVNLVDDDEVLALPA